MKENDAQVGYTRSILPSFTVYKWLISMVPSL